MQKKILVVEDNAEISRMLRRNLMRAGYGVYLAENGKIGMEKAFALQPDLILMDVDMPVMDGFSSLRNIRANEDARDIPILMLTAKGDEQTVKNTIQGGANDFIVKPFDAGLLLERITKWSNSKIEKDWEKLGTDQKQALQLTLKTLGKSFEYIRVGKPLPFQEIRETGQAILKIVDNGEIENILATVKEHDKRSFVHSLRVAAYLGWFARFKNLSPKDIITVIQSGLLHDIGKAKIPLGILYKTGELNETEWVEIRKHVKHAVSILKEIPETPPKVIEIIACHHEKIDGSGYPYGLDGNRVGLLGRMISIVDAFETLTAKEVYKESMNPEEALQVMLDCSGHFDQDILREFKEMILA